MRFRLVDPETLIDIEDGSTTSGEIWCRSPNIIRGYYRNDTATAESFHDG
jgi:long-subunit acyl-CoA synthetase (AMP-forming)